MNRGDSTPSTQSAMSARHNGCGIEGNLADQIADAPEDEHDDHFHEIVGMTQEPTHSSRQMDGSLAAFLLVPEEAAGLVIADEAGCRRFPAR